MTAFGQTHAHDGIARLKQGEEHRLVSLRTGVGLYIGERSPIELLYTVDGKLLDEIDVFAAAVVSLAGVAFGILVGELRALHGHQAGEV